MTENTPTTDADGTPPDATEQRTAVRERYGGIAAESSTCCGDSGSGNEAAAEQSRELGYSDDDLDAVGAGANLGLGCGNPTAIASLEEGDTVLDLGSGGGFDCFLAAREVGPAGRVVGVDMTPEMVEKARANVETNDATNVEFRLGEIEHLPVADESVDVIISNCVINLSPDKRRVFREAYRVLRPGGRLAISDVVSTAELPAEVRADPSSVAACIAGASSIPALESMLTDAGFADASVEPNADSESFVSEWDDERDLSDYIVAATIEGEKPATGQQL
ncbi:arsenite methyltransferase [Halorarum halophilum]|uniref:Arsenite methyltransferase n=1 Tax=Halorarum halophilum TaxID=2743090 RepID=A0A7D5GJT9_9EURY|nr:arsenite methyltransferase [Halobaculum halophilum]QLG29171.1 arsenite methyltransferase [Halobaculum halophilum]